MKPETLFKFKNLFENQKREILLTTQRAGEEFMVNKEDLFDEVDLTSTELEAGMRMRLRSREALFLRKIEDALQRITEGRFGLCDDCGEEIDLRRLEARPTASLCMHCKEDQERQEQIHIDGHRHKSLGRKLKLAGADR